jgi:polar amino acid transport system substrate-binding protein
MRRLALATALFAWAATPATAREVTVAVGLFLPPYVIADEWRGLEFDIVKRSLELAGHSIKPHATYLARVAKELDQGIVDAAMPTQPQQGARAFYSDWHVQYRNFAITLKSKDIRIGDVKDLAGHSIVAFQEAVNYLGPEFQTMAKANPNYREEARQVVQPVLLFLGRTEVVVADRMIFNWFASSPEVRDKADVRQAVTYHGIFPPTRYHVAFRDPSLRDDFNRGLKDLRDSGEYDRIVASYERPLTASLQ